MYNASFRMFSHPGKRGKLASDFRTGFKMCVQNGSTDGNFVAISVTFAVYMYLYVSNIAGLPLSFCIYIYIYHVRNFNMYLWQLSKWKINNLAYDVFTVHPNMYHVKKRDPPTPQPNLNNKKSHRTEFARWMSSQYHQKHVDKSIMIKQMHTNASFKGDF